MHTSFNYKQCEHEPCFGQYHLAIQGQYNCSSVKGTDHIKQSLKNWWKNYLKHNTTVWFVCFIAVNTITVVLPWKKWLYIVDKSILYKVVFLGMEFKRKQHVLIISLNIELAP